MQASFAGSLAWKSLLPLGPNGVAILALLPFPTAFTGGSSVKADLVALRFPTFPARYYVLQPEPTDPL